MKINLLALSISMLLPTAALCSTTNDISITTYVNYALNFSNGKFKCKARVIGSSNNNSVALKVAQVDEKGVPVHLDSWDIHSRDTSYYLSSENEIESDGNVSKTSQNCALLEATIDGYGRGNTVIEHFNNETNSAAFVTNTTWKSGHGEFEPFKDAFQAAQVLSLPLAAKYGNFDHLLNDMDVVLNNKGLAEEYKRYSDLVYSGDIGVTYGIMGFAREFLMLKNEREINEFIKDKVVGTAIKLDLIDRSLDTISFADAVRKEVLYLLGQDFENEYGSPEHVETSILVQYSGLVPRAWQLNNASLPTLTLDTIKKIDEKVLDEDAIVKDISDRHDTKINSLNEMMDLLLIYDGSTDGFNADYAKSILKPINGISVDFSKGMITNTDRYGGYLGKTYATIAEDLYGKSIEDLKYEELLKVKISLNAIGIDTNYSYGSLRNIQSSVLRRLDANISESTFSEQISEGSDPELLEALGSQSGLDFTNHVKDLLFDTYVYSGIDSLEDYNVSHKSSLNVKFWENSKKGVVGDLYAYANPFNHTIDFFRLNTLDYGYFPKNHKSNKHWSYAGIREWNTKGNVGDVYIYDNPYTGDIELFRLKGLYTSYFPTNKTSNEDWSYVSLGNWSPDDKGKKGDIYIYNNPSSQSIELFVLNHDGNYGYFPVDATSNESWTFLGTLNRKVDKDEFVVYEHRYNEGKSRVITESMPSLGSFDNYISSYKIPEGMSVVFYSEPNYTGKRWTRHAGSKDTIGFNDVVSSIEIVGEYKKENFVIYEHCNKKGAYRVVTENIPYLGDFNDKMSSYYIPYGLKVRFYEDANYQGGYYTRVGGEEGKVSFADKISSIKILEDNSDDLITGIGGLNSSRSYDSSRSSEGNKAKEALYDMLVEINNKMKVISSYEKIIDYNEEGAPLYSVPLTDVAYTKAHLYEIGMDKEWVERNWEPYFEQKNSRRPSLLPFFMNGVPFTPGNKHVAILEAFERETGRSAYNSQDMWSHYFNKMSRDISDYIALNIAFKAKMMNKAPWIESVNREISVRLNTGYSIEKYRYNSSWSSSEWVEPDKWVLNSETMNYSAILGNSVLNMFYLEGLELGVPINFSPFRDSILYKYMNAKRAKDCDVPTYAPDDLVTGCEARVITRRTIAGSEREAIDFLVHAYLMKEKSQFKTIKTNEIFLNVLKGFLPLWGTIEDIQKGDVGMSILGIIGDVMFFVPVAGDMYDTALFTVKAIKHSKLTGSAKFIKSPVALGNSSKTLVVGGNVDTAYYAGKALNSVKRIPASILNELNPFGAGSVDDLLAIGRVDMPKIPDVDYVKPNPDFDVTEFMDSKFEDHIWALYENHDGTYTINHEFIAIKWNNSFYLVEKDLDGSYYIVGKDGSKKIPAINNGDSWQVDYSKSISNYDISRMTHIDGDTSGAEYIFEGIYQIDNKLAIKIDGQYYEVIWDPIYKSWYLYDNDFNRIFVSGPYKDNWFINNNVEVCSI